MLGRRFNSETRKRRANLAIMVGHLVVWPIVLVIGFGVAGMRFNATPSVPTGIYWISSDPTVAFVEFCPPEPFGRMSVERLYRAKSSDRLRRWRRASAETHRGSGRRQC